MGLICYSVALWVCDALILALACYCCCWFSGAVMTFMAASPWLCLVEEMYQEIPQLPDATGCTIDARVTNLDADLVLTCRLLSGEVLSVDLHGVLSLREVRSNI